MCANSYLILRDGVILICTTLVYFKDVHILNIYIYKLDKIMKTSGNSNKFILIWFSDCSPPLKSGYIQLPSYSF